LINCAGLFISFNVTLLHSKKCWVVLAHFFNTILGQIGTNSKIGLKMLFKNVTQWLGLSIF